MILNALFTLSLFTLCAGSISTLVSLKTRYIVTLLSFLTLFISYFILSFNGKRPHLFSWIHSEKSSLKNVLPAFLFFLGGFVFYFLIPETGINVTHIFPNDRETAIRLHLDELEILPTHYPKQFPPNNEEGALFYSFSFFVRENIPSLLLYASHGKVDWLLNGRLIYSMKDEDVSRFSLIVNDIKPGYHLLQCKIENFSPIPQISVRGGTGKPIQGPFFDSEVPPNLFLASYSKDISIVSFLLFFFFFIPILNKILRSASAIATRYKTISSLIVVLLSLSCFLLIRYQFSINTNRLFEADEAAFGLMSQHLLNGQSPPLFHYGQNYQGTIESYPLSLSLIFSDNLIFGLHLLPLLWGVFFILIALITFYLFGSKGLTLFSFISLSLGGLHFHWIISKTWFGYSFSLFAGSLLWLIVFNAYKKKRLFPGAAFLWGAVSGICMYELPIVFPFVFSSSLVILKLFLDDLLSRIDSKYLYKSLKSHFFQSFFRSGALIALISFFLTLFPYWSGLFLEKDSGAARFIVEGRHLAPARLSSENPLIDRFFCECIPVLFGARAPYDQQYNLPLSLFSDFPSIFFFLSLFIFPFISKKIFPSNSLFQSKTILFSFISFYAITILLVSFSPFGIWPWYAIPLFWIIPILFYSTLSFIWKYSPSLSFLGAFIILISIFSSFLNYREFFHQPSSLSHQGFSIPTDFERIKTFLDENNFRYLLCDQGFDFSDTDVGRDWIGETLMYSADGKFSSVDRLSRRLPDSANEIVQSSRVCYLFHKDYLYRQPGDINSSSLSFNNFEKLFGADYFNFDRTSFDPYVLFSPPQFNGVYDKKNWSASSSNPIYLLSSYDHNISFRGSGRDIFWSSDSIPDTGCFYKITFPVPKTIQTIVLFHGTKTSDRTQENSVVLTLEDGFSFNAGSLSYVDDIRSSVLSLPTPRTAKEIRINVDKPRNDRWWTICEFWAF